jgi:hypothetical protein
MEDWVIMVTIVISAMVMLLAKSMGNMQRFGRSVIIFVRVLRLPRAAESKGLQIGYFK